MNTSNPNFNQPNFESLARSLLKIDLDALKAFGTRNGGDGTVAAGLHEFMRMMLARALSLLWAPDDLQLQLCTETLGETAECDWKIYNMIQLFAWSLVRVPRHSRGLADLELCVSDATSIQLPRVRGRGEIGSSVCELVSAAAAILEPDFDAIRDTRGPKSSVPISTLLGDLLSLQPERLIRPHYSTKEAAEAAFAQDAEGQIAAGLSATLMRIVHHYGIIVETGKGCDLRFWIADDETYEGADTANFSALLTASLFSDGNRDLAFVGKSGRGLS